MQALRGDRALEIRIREARRNDEPALAALEYAAPDAGTWQVRLEMRAGYLELVARYPDVRGYVAVTPDAADGARVVGMLFSSVASTQFDGAVVPGAYLFSLRVHPTVRQRGVGSSLVKHAVEQARAAGAEIAWAVVASGNDPSLRTFLHAGFERLRDVALRLVLPALRSPRIDGAWKVRQVATADLPALADALNRAHATHDFWRPTEAAELGRQLEAGRHGVNDASLVLDAGGTILAAGAPFDIGRLANVRLLGHRALPPLVNRLLAAGTARLLRPGRQPRLLRQRVLLPHEPQAAKVLLRAVQWHNGSANAALAIPLDRRDTAWPVVASLPGLTSRLHVVARSSRPVRPARPVYVA